MPNTARQATPSGPPAQGRSAKKMTLEQFHEETFAVAHAIYDLFESNPPDRLPRAARDWPELQSFARSAAERLMLCSDVEAGISQMRDNPEFLTAATGITTRVDVEATRKAMIAEYENGTWTSHEFLPCAPFASYLLELIDMIEPADPLGAQQDWNCNPDHDPS